MSYLLLEDWMFFAWFIGTLGLVMVLVTILWFSRGLPWLLIKTKIKGGGALAFIARPDRNIVIRPAKVVGDSWFVPGYGRFFTNRKTTYLIEKFPGRAAIFLSSLAYAVQPRVVKAFEVLKGKGYKDVKEVIQGTTNYVKEYRKMVLDQHLKMFQERAKAKGEEIPQELPPEYIEYLDKQGLLKPPKVDETNPLESLNKIPVDPPMGYDGWNVSIDEVTDWLKDYTSPLQIENLVKKTKVDVYNDLLSTLPGGEKKPINLKLIMVLMLLLMLGVGLVFLTQSGGLRGIIPGL